jgi:hypothetical protein
VTRSVERLASQQKEPSRRNRVDCDRPIFAEGNHPACFEGVAFDPDAAVGDVDRPLFVLGRKLQSGAFGEHSVGVEHLRKDGQRRA